VKVCGWNIHTSYPQHTMHIKHQELLEFQSEAEFLGGEGMSVSLGVKQSAFARMRGHNLGLTETRRIADKAHRYLQRLLDLSRSEDLQHVVRRYSLCVISQYSFSFNHCPSLFLALFLSDMTHLTELRARLAQQIKQGDVQAKQLAKKVGMAKELLQKKAREKTRKRRQREANKRRPQPRVIKCARPIIVRTTR
jgi:hypothetical protein